MNGRRKTEDFGQVQRWQPWMIYCWTRKQLQHWYDTHGSFALYNGKSWCPKAKSLGVGRYEVRFQEYQQSGGR